jgi:hypothetical protein
MMGHVPQNGVANAMKACALSTRTNPVSPASFYAAYYYIIRKHTVSYIVMLSVLLLLKGHVPRHLYSLIGQVPHQFHWMHAKKVGRHLPQLIVK